MVMIEKSKLSASTIRNFFMLNPFSFEIIFMCFMLCQNLVSTFPNWKGHWRLHINTWKPMKITLGSELDGTDLIKEQEEGRNWANGAGGVAAVTAVRMKVKELYVWKELPEEQPMRARTYEVEVVLKHHWFFPFGTCMTCLYGFF